MMRVLLTLMKMAKFKRLQTCTEVEVLQHDLAAKNGFAALPDAFCRKYLKQKLVKKLTSVTPLQLRDFSAQREDPLCDSRGTLSFLIKPVKQVVGPKRN